VTQSNFVLKIQSRSQSLNDLESKQTISSLNVISIKVEKFLKVLSNRFS